MGIATKALMAVLAISLVAMKIFFLRHELLSEQAKNAVLTQDNAERAVLIHQFQQAEIKNKQRLARLQTEHQRITQTLTQRETLIEDLLNDDPHSQSWSNTPLPDALIRLRRRPAATGAGDYYPGLSDAHPLHQPLLPASSSSDH